MLAKKCDRCGKLYESYDMVDNSEMNGVYIVSKNKFGVRESISKDIDLCQECMDSFIKWYEMKGE